MHDLELEYRDWLVDQVNIVEDKDYGPLLRKLYQMEFYWVVPNDEDRAMDGMALRDAFGYEVGIREQLYFGPAKVLEVLIGIAKRVEFQLFGGPYMDEWGYQKVFWDLIWNLGLEGMYDTLFDEDVMKIDEIVTFFMERRKNVTQKHHIFGLENHGKSIQKMSLWAQMMIYIKEKWPK